MIDPEITDIEHRIAERELSIDDVLMHSGVAKTTWWRWRQRGQEPRLSTLRKMRRSIEELAGSEQQ